MVLVVCDFLEAAGLGDTLLVFFALVMAKESKEVWVFFLVGEWVNA